jgi:hypothetical protein
MRGEQGRTVEGLQSLCDQVPGVSLWGKWDQQVRRIPAGTLGMWIRRKLRDRLKVAILVFVA